MPVTQLLVEGHLDVQLLSPFLCGSPVVTMEGSKTTLASLARGLRRSQKSTAICYLRDRDFDYEPDPIGKLTLDKKAEDGSPLGWHWSRHEIESYLLEPNVVAAAVKWPASEYIPALKEAALSIFDYEAARWVIGAIRSHLPPNYKLQTRPEKLANYQLPKDITAMASRAWMCQEIASFRDGLYFHLEESTIRQVFEEKQRFLKKTVLSSSDSEQTLSWFSGKDLLAALREKLLARFGKEMSPAKFVERIAAWVGDNPILALPLLPEWKQLIDTVRS